MKFLNKKTWILVFALLINLSLFPKIKVACIGNSITYGYGLSSPSTQSYPSRLQILLGNDYEVSNFGVSARTLLKKGDRPYWNETQYTQALNLNPDIVVIMLGTNDAKLSLNWTPYKSEFKDDYKAMIKSFSDLSSKPKIWICKIVPAYQTIWDISDATIKNEVNPKIKEVALEEGLSLIDMYTAMENKSAMFQSDGIHPNANGAQEMANYIYGILIQDTIKIQVIGDTLKAPLAVNYQWYFNGRLIDEQENGMSKELIADSTGIFKVGVKFTAGSETTIMSEPFYFEKSTEVKLLQSENDQFVKIYPVPCSDVLNIQLNNSVYTSYEFNIYKPDGQLLFSRNIEKTNNVVAIDVRSFSDGIYIYKINNADFSAEFGRFIINHLR